MGKKKVSQLAMSSTTKNEKQLHRLINVLRPKVYITDSSSFKQLVQELTGYRTQTKYIPFMDSSFCTFETSEQAFQLKEINRVSDLMQEADQDILMFDHVSLSTSQGQSDWLACQNLESWLFDADDHDPYSWYTGCHLIEQETSIFDYELLY